MVDGVPLRNYPFIVAKARRSFLVLRLTPSQQTSRYTSRGKMVVNPWDPANLARIPCEKPPVESGSLGSSDFFCVVVAILQGASNGMLTQRNTFWHIIANPIELHAWSL